MKIQNTTRCLVATLAFSALALTATQSHAASVSSAIGTAYSFQGAPAGTPVAIIAQDDFYVDFVDVNGSGFVDAGDHFVGIIELFNFRPAGEFDATTDIIDDVTPTGPTQNFSSGLYGIFEVEITSAPLGQFQFSAGSGSVTFVETTSPVNGLGASFGADTTAIFGASGATTVAIADFSGGGSTFWDVDTTTVPLVDAFDISLNFSSESGLLPSGFNFAENELGTQLFGTVGDSDNFFFFPGASGGTVPFGAGYFAGGDGDFAIVVTPSPTAAAFGLFGLAAVGIRRRRSAKA